MEDLTNQKFHHLTAMSPVRPNKNRNWIWLCKCDCGKETEVLASKLKNGHTKSCSCIKKLPPPKYGSEHHGWQGYEQISKSFYSRMMSSAKLRNRQWELTPEYLWDLYIKQDKKCALSGRPIEMPIFIRQLRDKNDQNLASLDRINPSIDYVEGNVQWVCKRINYMKHILNETDFLGYIKDIYEHLLVD